MPRVAQTVGRTFLLTPLREGRQDVREAITYPWYFYSRPCERGDRHPRPVRRQRTYFYSRPCERGDDLAAEHLVDVCVISTHAPARGATNYGVAFYDENKFLLTPLREGRPLLKRLTTNSDGHFYSRPCERGDGLLCARWSRSRIFLLTPLREGRLKNLLVITTPTYFYSRPCERGDQAGGRRQAWEGYFYSRPCERGDEATTDAISTVYAISTHAPARGATKAVAAAFRA